MEEAKARASSSIRLKVVMFPFVANGHISPFLELAKKLSTSDRFHTYLCSTPINLTSIRNTLKNNSWDFPTEFIDLHLPHSPDFPPQFHTTKDLPSHLIPTLIDAFDNAKPNFANILCSLKPDLVIYDGLQPWASEIASSLDIPAVHFCIIGAAPMSYICHHVNTRSQDISTAGSYPLPGIYRKDFFVTKENVALERVFKSFRLSRNIVLINSCRETEGEYLEYLTSLVGKKMVPLGPLVQEPKSLDSHRHIFEWLDSKTESSVVFVCFGSEYFLSKEEIIEIASGLELSNANFLWAMRISKGSTIKEAFPQGFLERVKDRGMVVEGWAPQARILQHQSIGGFVSHCGWNSVMESLYYGVAVIAVPIQYEQLLNAMFMEGIGVGIEVSRDEGENIRGVNISNVIKRVMVEKDGERLRGKARELSEKLRMEKESNVIEATEELIKVCQDSRGRY